MAKAIFNHVRIRGIKTIVPDRFIDIDDEIEYFGNSVRQLERAKKMVGFGRRPVLPEGVTVVDLCEKAAADLLGELGTDRGGIDALILVNQRPDYFFPASSYLLHDRLGLGEECAVFDVGLGCSGYVYGLWLAHSLIASGASTRVLLVARDSASTHADLRNRLYAPLFGDAASATLLEHEPGDNPAWFALGARGAGWDKIVVPAGGRRLPIRKDMCDVEVQDAAGNVWHPWDGIIRGMDIFNFTMEVVPGNIRELLAFAGKGMDEIDFFALHQANKQIVETIVAKTGIPREKTSWETFSRYGNNSTTSVATVLCDQRGERPPLGRCLLSAFGVGLSWGSAIVGLEGCHNGGIGLYPTPEGLPGRAEQLEAWIRYFLGDQR